MFAVINKYGVVVQVASKDLGKEGFSYAEIPDTKVLDAIRGSKPVKYVEGAFVITEPFRSKTWEQIRADREPLFSEADAQIFKLRDSEVIEAKDNSQEIKAWALYRESLRDITEQDSPDNVTWPTRPTDV